MDVKQKGKLERYFKNADQFMWGLAGRNQQKAYDFLRTLELEFRRAPYSQVADELVRTHGIETILNRAVVPTVKKLFSDKTLEYLRTCWRAGRTPDIAVLREYNVHDPSPFVVINWQYNYVERWGMFAGVWFEEIEGSLGP